MRRVRLVCKRGGGDQRTQIRQTGRSPWPDDTEELTDWRAAPMQGHPAQVRRIWLTGGIFVGILLLSLAAPERPVAGQGGTVIHDCASVPCRIFMPLAEQAQSEEATPEPTEEPTPEPTETPEPTPGPTFDAIPVSGPPVDRPAEVNGDVNLALRGYVETAQFADLIDVGGDTDPDAPQLSALFTPQRRPAFQVVYQVHQWDWGCGDIGCRGAPIAYPEVTMVGVATTPGEPITIPSRNADIYQGVYIAMVIYAAPDRITLKYTREDSPVFGYMVHLEGVTVEPTLVALYNQLNAAGRGSLPALRNGERLGNAAAEVMGVVVRDTGSFMDPRSRKDWWRGWTLTAAGIRHSKP